MSGSTSAQAFDETYGSYAQEAGAQLGVSPSIILSQWALESGNGTNTGATVDNNPGSIESNGQLVQYSSAAAFEGAYVNTIENDFPNAVNSRNSVTNFVNGLANGIFGSYFGSGDTASQYAAGINAEMGNTTTTPTSTTTSATSPATSASTAQGILSGLTGGVSLASIGADIALVAIGVVLIYVGITRGGVGNTGQVIVENLGRNAKAVAA